MIKPGTPCLITVSPDHPGHGQTCIAIRYVGDYMDYWDWVRVDDCWEVSLRDGAIMVVTSRRLIPLGGDLDDAEKLDMNLEHEYCQHKKARA